MGRPVIILYTDQASIAPEVLTAMTEAGYLPVKVADADAVRVLDIPIAATVDDADISLVNIAAFKALRHSTTVNTNWTASFGEAVIHAVLARAEKTAKKPA